MFCFARISMHGLIQVCLVLLNDYNSVAAHFLTEETECSSIFLASIHLQYAKGSERKTVAVSQKEKEWR